MGQVDQYLEAWRAHEKSLFESDYEPVIRQKCATFTTFTGKFLEQLERDGSEAGEREGQYHGDMQGWTQQLNEVKLLMEGTMKDYSAEEEAVLTAIKNQRTKVLNNTRKLCHQQEMHQGQESKQRNIQLLSALRDIK